MLLKLVQVRPTALRNCRTNRMNDVEIGAFFPGTDIVKRTDLPFLECIQNCPTVILDVEPVTNLLAVAIYGKIRLTQSVSDQQRNEFFRKLIRAVIIRAPRHDNRYAIGSKIRKT